MNEKRLYEIIRPETAERRARWFRGGRDDCAARRAGRLHEFHRRVRGRDRAERRTTPARDRRIFGEIALLTGARRTATVVATRACTLLRLDIADFREPMGRQPDLARAVYDAVHQRLDAVGTEPTPEGETAWEFGISA